MSDEHRTEARELRAAGWTLRKIGDRFGVAAHTAKRWVDPLYEERQRRMSLEWKRRNPDRRRDYDLAYKEAHRQLCEMDCGRLVTYGHRTCRRCLMEAAENRRVLIGEMYEEGLSMRDIAEAVGTTVNALSVDLDRLGKLGRITRKRRPFGLPPLEDAA